MDEDDRLSWRLIEFAPDAICVASGGQVVYANAACLRMVGASSLEEIKGMPLLSFAHPDDRGKLESQLKELAAHHVGLPPTSQRLRRLDGTTVRVEVAVILTGYEGEESVQVILRDVSERVRQEEALRQSEARYRGLFESSSELIYRIDTEGRVLEVNPATLRVTGWGSEDLIGRPFMDFVHEDDGERAMDAFHATLHEQPSRLVIRIRTNTNAYVSLDTVNNPVVEDGRVVAVFGTARDITTTRLAMDALRERENLLSVVLDALPVGVIVVDQGGMVVRSNPAGHAIWGFDRRYAAIAAPGQYRARWVDSGKPVTREEWASTRALLEGKSTINDLVEIEAADGVHRIIMNSAVPLFNDPGAVSGAVVINQDITDLRRKERDLETAQRLSAIGHLAATVAHEFNNVLMGISPFMEVIDRRAESDEPLRSLSQNIQQALHRGKQITREILKFAQAPEPDMRATRIHHLLQSSLPELRAIAGRKILVVIGDVSEDLAACIDATQVHQVLSNLVSNARDAMNGEGTIHIEAGVARAGEIAQHGEWMRISLTDTGNGIAPQHLARIFEPMFTTKQAGGTGLGLAVVQQVVTRHGGVIEVDSVENRGTTFRLYFRLCDPPEQPAEARENTGIRSVHTIVLVEDDPIVSAGLQAVLELEGISTHVVSFGAQAENAVARHSPDAVVLDRGLPDMDGLEVARRLLFRWPTLPIVFSTGHGDREDLEGMARGSRVAYLLKPYSVSALLDTLDKMLQE